MDRLSSLKRKRGSSPPPPDTKGSKDAISALSVPDDDESTDFKLALLSSLLPSVEQSVLLDLLLESDGSVAKASAWLTRASDVPSKRHNTTSQQTSLTSFVALNQENEPRKPLSKKGKTLHLYSSEDIAKHTPCSIVHNFLPAKIATNLLKELLDESKTYESTTFKLFDNVVQSPHTSCFYVGSYEEMQTQKTE